MTKHANPGEVFIAAFEAHFGGRFVKEDKRKLTPINDYANVAIGDTVFCTESYADLTGKPAAIIAMNNGEADPAATTMATCISLLTGATTKTPLGQCFRSSRARDMGLPEAFLGEDMRALESMVASKPKGMTPAEKKAAKEAKGAALAEATQGAPEAPVEEPKTSRKRGAKTETPEVQQPEAKPETPAYAGEDDFGTEEPAATTPAGDFDEDHPEVTEIINRADTDTSPKTNLSEPGAVEALRQRMTEEPTGSQPDTTPEAMIATTLEREGRINSFRAQELTGLDAAGVKAILDGLIEQGLVTTEGQKRGKVYVWQGTVAEQEKRETEDPGLGNITEPAPGNPNTAGSTIGGRKRGAKTEPQTEPTVEEDAEPTVEVEVKVAPRPEPIPPAMKEPKESGYRLPTLALKAIGKQLPDKIDFIEQQLADILEANMKGHLDDFPEERMASVESSVLRLLEMVIQVGLKGRHDMQDSPVNPAFSIPAGNVRASLQGVIFDLGTAPTSRKGLERAEKTLKDATKVINAMRIQLAQTGMDEEVVTGEPLRTPDGKKLVKS